VHRPSESIDFRLNPGSAHIDRFREKLHGSLIVQGDAGYDEARRVWNGMVDKRPAIIVFCAATMDVVEAVVFARAHSLLVSVERAGIMLPVAPYAMAASS